MKLLREYIRETLREDNSDRNIETVGDLKLLIKAATSKKKEDQGRAAFKDLASGLIADLIPGAGTVKGGFDALKTMYSMPDDKRTGTALDYLDVDDPVAAIVDDNVENRFLKAVSDKLGSMDDNKPLSQFNITKLLAKFIKKEFEDRTIIGFE